MERSFREEVRSLRLGEGDVFHGEGILARYCRSRSFALPCTARTCCRRPENTPVS